MKLRNRVALVTGSSRGIGRSIASALAEEGAAVAVNYRSRAEEAAQVVKHIEETGGRAVALQADVSDPAEAERLVAEATEALGGLHILINNAGVSDDSLLHKMSGDSWRRVMEINFGGVFNCTRAVMDHFMMERDGAIVNISSGMGERGWMGLSTYAASKGAVNSFTKCSALELARFGVRVNAVTAGFVPTDLVAPLLERHASGGITKQIPLGDVATPEQVADVAVFLAGPSASYMTGQLVGVDGGSDAQFGIGRPLPKSSQSRGR